MPQWLPRGLREPARPHHDGATLPQVSHGHELTAAVVAPAAPGGATTKDADAFVVTAATVTKTPPPPCYAGEAVVVPLQGGGSEYAAWSSVYDAFSRRRRYAILSIIALAVMLCPFADCIYLPAMPAVLKDFQTSTVNVDLSITLYMLGVAISSLMWGPVSDYWGRRPVLLTGLVTFVAWSVGCWLAPSIGALLAFRMLQGMSAGAFGGLSGAVAADLVPAAERGAVMGLTQMPLSIGPILGPVLGGALSGAFGWRSTMLAVGLAAAVVVLPLVVFGVPETSQRTTLARVVRADPAAAERLRTVAKIPLERPPLRAPWMPYVLLARRAVLPHAAQAFVAFGAMFVSVVELSWFLAAEPYHLSPAMIGIACLAQNAAGLFIAPLGGKLSDVTAALQSDEPALAAFASALFGSTLMPTALLVYGVGFHFKAHISVGLVGLFFVGVSVSILLPGIMNFLTVYFQHEAGAASSGLMSLLFLACFIMQTAASTLLRALSTGGLFGLLAALNCFVSLWGVASVLRAWRRAKARIAEREAQDELELEAASAGKEQQQQGDTAAVLAACAATL